MSTELTIIKKENAEMIVSLAPQAYTENQVSHDRCLSAGRTLLETIEKEGMNDALDQKTAEYIARSRKTVNKMNEKRAPVTKLFDEIRTAFTKMENEVDPTKKDSIPAILQQCRNKYAAKKQAEAETRRREEVQRQQMELARSKYRTDCEEDYRQSFNRTLNTAINEITAINTSITLENIDEKSKLISSFPVCLQESWFSAMPSSVIMPTNVPHQELMDIREQVKLSLKPKFMEQYQFEMESTRDTYLDMLPSKRRELENMAKANAEEAARIKAEIAARESEEARKKEEERKRKEDEEARKKEFEKQSVNVGELFGMAQASTPIYQPKMQVRKKLVPLNIEAFMPILSMWWTGEGCTLTVPELTKIFTKQISYCEKCANDKNNPVLIESKHISYEDDVKAK